MRFEELEKKHQELLMYSLSDYIKKKARKWGIDNPIEPTYEEYKEFFNKFDQDYEIVDDYPESNACNKFSLDFVGSKAVLEVD